MSTKTAWPTRQTIAQYSHAVLLRGEHKAGATIRLQADDIVSTARVGQGEHIQFLDVKPSRPGDVVGAVALTNDLTGEALVVIDKSMANAGQWPTPNGSDIDVAMP